MATDESVEAAAEYMENMIELELPMTYRRRREILSMLGYYDEVLDGD